MGHKRSRPQDRDPGIELAKWNGVAKRLRGILWTAEPGLMAHHRREWPDLWRALDDLVALTDEVSPPYGSGDEGRLKRGT